MYLGLYGDFLIWGHVFSDEDSNLFNDQKTAETPKHGVDNETMEFSVTGDTESMETEKSNGEYNKRQLFFNNLVGNAYYDNTQYSQL